MKLHSLKYLPFLFLIIACGKPIANFTYNETERTAPVEIQFENISEKAESYQWDFGDGTTSEEASPTHNYGSSGNYTVVLKAKKGKKETAVEKQVFIGAPKDCLVQIITDYGTMTVQLSNATPLHRDNFVKLAEEGYYDGLLFHRVINGFMIQGGDPRSRNARPDQRLGSGGPGYQVPAEFVDTLVHIKGAIAAARTGDAVNPKRESSGSQFYIVQGQAVNDARLDALERQKGKKYTAKIREEYKRQGGTPFLDRDYTVFGYVIDGIEVIDKIANAQTGEGDRPATDVKMTIKIID